MRRARAVFAAALLLASSAHGLIPAPVPALRGHLLGSARGGRAPLCSGQERGVAQFGSRVLGFLDRQFFLVGVAGAVGAAAAAPALGSGPLLGLAASWGAPCGIFLIAGLNMPTDRLAAAATRVRAHAAIQAFSLGAIPLITLAACAALSTAGLLSPPVRDGMLTLSVLPTTVNMCVALSRTAGGDEALAVFNAILGNLLGIVVTPALLLFLLGRTGAVPVVAAVKSLVLKVLLPLTVGQLLQRVSAVREIANARKKALSRSSESLLLLTVYATFASTFLRGFGLPARAVAATGALVGAIHAVALALAWAASKALAPVLPSMSDRIAFLYCSTQKTLALGLPLMRIIFAGRADLAVLCTPLLIQHPLQLLVGSILAPRLAAAREVETAAQAAQEQAGKRS